MTADIILWILGVAVTVLMVAFGFHVTWNRGQDDRMGKIEKDLSALARHTAENYVRGHEIAEVKKVVADMRAEMSGVVGELRVELTHKVDELTKAVYQLLGQQNAK